MHALVVTLLLNYLHLCATTPQELRSSHAKAFISKMVKTTQSLLSLSDSIITSREIVPGS